MGHHQWSNGSIFMPKNAGPTPKIDIVVNVPADYPGTFLDYKQELTQKLIDQGLKRIGFPYYKYGRFHRYDEHERLAGIRSLFQRDSV